jgi:hypothetical protein
MVMSNLNRDVLAFQPEKALFQDLQNFSKSAYEEARLVVSEKMPKKILKLTKFLKVIHSVIILIFRKRMSIEAFSSVKRNLTVKEARRMGQVNHWTYPRPLSLPNLNSPS